MKIRKPVKKEKKPALSNNEKQKRYQGLKALKLEAQEFVLTWLKLHAPEAQEIVANVRRITKLKKGWQAEDLKNAKTDFHNYKVQALSKGVLSAESALNDLAQLKNRMIKGVSDKDSTNNVLSAYGLVQAIFQAYGLEPAQIAAIAYSLANDIGCSMLRKGADVAPECKAVAFCMALTDYSHTKPEWVKPVVDEMLEANFTDLHAMMYAPEPYFD